MSAQISINPFIQTVGNNGLFGVKSDGVRQGTAYPDPATRNAQRTCILAESETLPMWGGIAVYENIPGVAGDPNSVLGPVVGRANSLTGSKAIAGFSVFDGAYGMVTSPQSTVPLIGSFGQVMTYALGSRARIAVQCDPVLVDLRGDPIGSQVSWDWVNELLVPYEGSALTISSGTYNSTTGIVTLTMSAPIDFGPGDAIVVASLTGTGTNLATLNGTWTAAAGTTGSTVVYQAPTGEGAITITGGSLTLGSGTASALPVKVLEVMDSNCETVMYDPVTGFATWDYNGACAIIQI